MSEENAAERKVDRRQPEDQYADGVWVELGGRREYLVPALNFRSLKEYQPRLAELSKATAGGLPTDEQMELMILVSHAALIRNYPKMEKDELYDLVDMGNFEPLFMAIVGASQLEQRKAGEAKAAS